jgi:hypothetical protein
MVLFHLFHLVRIYHSATFFWFSRKSKDTPELIPAHEANKEWPQIVIKFYEEHLHFRPTISDEH